ncbi:DUF6265 family protein [Flavobacterium sp. SUN052]|uniref:DUF6265 family protein n=1 Tax=Flavobacterium sp. SUN052 TaxID=3002441 RepID=UPI00237DD2DA|nr:DUF6265 family protein [Flavobacterium sp. SUN052]MEC4005715.1 DUF6265 family protein [Flavobacterium sp. SUN052]
MKNKSLIVAASIILMSLISCNKYDAKGNLIKSYDELQKAKWLVGDWKKTDSLGTLQEIWTSQDDSTFVGQSYYIQNEKDTLHNEQIQLTQDKEHLIYSTTVKGENNNAPVSFQMTKDKDSVLLFENPKNTYPEKIQYQLNKNNSLSVTISGKQKGKNSSETYIMTKNK